jgi:hypothetical protein
MKIPIRRVVAMVLGETDGEFLTEFQNFQNFVVVALEWSTGILPVFAYHFTGGTTCGPFPCICERCIDDSYEICLRCPDSNAVRSAIGTESFSF